MTGKNTFLFETAKKMRVFLREGWRQHPFAGNGVRCPQKIEPRAWPLGTPKLNREKRFEFAQCLGRSLDVFYDFAFVECHYPLADLNGVYQVMT